MTIKHNIRGHWMDDGYVDCADVLSIEIEADGTIYDGSGRAPNMPLRVEQWGEDCPIITNGCWTFAPDTDDLARAELVPVQMVAA